MATIFYWEVEEMYAYEEARGPMTSTNNFYTLRIMLSRSIMEREKFREVPWLELHRLSLSFWVFSASFVLVCSCIMF